MLWKLYCPITYRGFEAVTDSTLNIFTKYSIQQKRNSHKVTSPPTKMTVAGKLTLLTILMGLCILTGPTSAQGQAGNKVDGAIWRFTMTPKFQGAKKMGGKYRVLNNRIYQKADPNADKFSKQVGSNTPKTKKRKAVLTFTDLRALDKQKNWHNGIKAKIIIKQKKPGVGVGTMVDSEGRHWDFRCTRIQE